MARGTDMERLQEELSEAYKWGEEARARELIAEIATRPRKARALFEAMLSSPDARLRQAAAFCLGELGGAASARRLEQQLAIEEERDDHDGASVTEAITEALGRIQGGSARASLVRRLERLSTQAIGAEGLGSLVRALWRRRHPELIPAVQQALRRLPLPAANELSGLLVLLEKSPRDLSSWAEDPTVPVDAKTKLLTVLEEEVPDELLAVLPAFISAANVLADKAAEQRGVDSYYCDRLFILLLMHEQRVLRALPQQARSTLRGIARKLAAGKPLGCAVRAASLLQLIGQPEDAALLEAHRPAEPILAEVFDEAVRVLRGLHVE